MNLEVLNTQLSVPLIITGAVMIILGLFWLIRRIFQTWGGWALFPPTWLVFPVARFHLAAGPVVLVLLGLLLVSAPAAVSKLLPVDVAVRDKQVGDERHVTLTGAKSDPKAATNDYKLMLAEKKDADTLQMANDDVTDATLELLTGFTKLRKLDLAGSKVTDAGLKHLVALPALEELFLSRTAVTDAGLREHLMGHPTLKKLNVRDTPVTEAAAKEWQAAQPGRRVIR